MPVLAGKKRSPVASDSRRRCTQIDPASVGAQPTTRSAREIAFAIGASVRDRASFADGER
jgi:hypothetical protein